MSSSRFPVQFRLTRHNRNSVAALLAVLEAELGDQVAPALLSSPAGFDGGGLLVYSFATGAREAVAEEMAALRARFGPALTAAAGGAHPSAAPEDARALGFRWVFPGEAGKGFADLVRELASGELPAPGVRPAEPRLPLDTYDPWPRSGMLYTPVEITRGCAMSCAFCQTPCLFGRRPRHRSLPALRRLFARSVSGGHRFTRFVAPNAFGYGSADGVRPNLEALEALIRAAREAGFERVYLGTFPSEVRPESATPEALALVRRLCDNRALALGLQSGSDAVLRSIRRGHTVAQGIEAVRRAAAAGFEPRVDFIFGLPSETDDDRRRTREVIIDLVERCGAVIHPHRFQPLPGTPLAHATPADIEEETARLMRQLARAGRLTREGLPALG